MDAYAFTGAAGDIVTISAVKTDDGPACMEAFLYDPTGTLLGGTFCNGQRLDILSAAGTYTILVNDDGLRATGSYNLTLTSSACSGG